MQGGVQEPHQNQTYRPVSEHPMNAHPNHNLHLTVYSNIMDTGGLRHARSDGSRALLKGSRAVVYNAGLVPFEQDHPPPLVAGSKVLPIVVELDSRDNVGLGNLAVPGLVTEDLAEVPGQHRVLCLADHAVVSSSEPGGEKWRRRFGGVGEA